MHFADDSLVISGTRHVTRGTKRDRGGTSKVENTLVLLGAWNIGAVLIDKGTLHVSLCEPSLGCHQIKRKLWTSEKRP